MVATDLIIAWLDIKIPAEIDEKFTANTKAKLVTLEIVVVDKVDKVDKHNVHITILV